MSPCRKGYVCLNRLCENDRIIFESQQISPHTNLKDSIYINIQRACEAAKNLRDQKPGKIGEGRQMAIDLHRSLNLRNENRQWACV